MISIVIPTYEMYGTGSDFITQSLVNLKKQTYKDFEIIISDHSNDSQIENVIDNFSNVLNIKYYKYEKKRGVSSANLNNAIKKSNREYIKILFQDEFLIDDGLKKITDYLFKNKSIDWLISGCIYGSSLNRVSGSMLPKYNDQIIYGVNTIGSPSVLTVKNYDVELFDENLIWLLDCEYYYRLYNRFGSPNIINDYPVFISQHKYQVTNQISENLKKDEMEYIKIKYKL